ncbi:MAG: anaerobic ribonucleoside-triphosphate reductase activating protein [Candidatus Cryosericum sp.]
MVIGGFQRFSLADFPGKISAIVFTRGCNFRCPYCHNPELVDPARYTPEIPQEEVLRFLGSRRGQLQGVVVTGGEPTLHSDLPLFLAGIRALGFAAKLDTNGSNPDALQGLIRESLLDYIAMDIKAPLSAYPQIVRAPVKAEDIERSVRLVIASGLPHEFRTTYEGSLLSTQDMKAIAETVRGCAHYVVQSFRPSRALDPAMRRLARPNRESLQAIRKLMETAGLPAVIR